MALKGYRSYQGRGVRFKRIFILVLCVLVLLTAAAIVVFQKYPVLLEDGSLLWTKLWELPERNQEEQTPQTEPTEPTEPTEQTAEVVEPKEVEQVPLKVLSPLTELPFSQLSEGANGVVYTVKDDAGRIYYPSTAGQKDAVVAAAGVKAQLEQVCAREDIYAVARLNCLHDSYYAYTHVGEAALCVGGKLWADQRTYYWLDAEKDAARSYVVALAKECAALGFDEILLDELCYPVGDLTASQHRALVALVEEMRQELDGVYDIRITLMLDATHLSDATLLSALLSVVDGVYTQQDVTYVQERMGEQGKNIPLLIWSDNCWIEISK